MGAFGLSLLLLDLQLLFLGTVTGCVVVGLAFMQAVADSLRKGCVARLIVVGLSQPALGLGGDGAGA